MTSVVALELTICVPLVLATQRRSCCERGSTIVMSGNGRLWGPVGGKIDEATGTSLWTNSKTDGQYDALLVYVLDQYEGTRRPAGKDEPSGRSSTRLVREHAAHLMDVY